MFLTFYYVIRLRLRLFLGYYRNNSTADCSISLKFGTKFHHLTGDTQQMFKVKGQGHNVT